MGEFEIQSEIERHKQNGFRELPGKHGHDPYKSFTEEKVIQKPIVPNKKGWIFGKKQPEIIIEQPKSLFSEHGAVRIFVHVEKIKKEIPFHRLEEWLTKANHIGITPEKITFEEPKEKSTAQRHEELLKDI